MKKNKDDLINELKEFLYEYKDDVFNEDNYQKTINAIVSGNLVLNGENGPEYKLLKSIHSGTEHEISSVIFKTRILPTKMAQLMKGIEIEKDKGTLTLRLITHIAGLTSVNELDRLSKKNYEFITEFSPVFM